ncbi:MAG: phytanoyl-CoA dioxygenase family protein [Myxococcaceae bacterium]|nr:phytanoyl-CoA dioxygenase family protein [Myxococcaceae bacterium]
MSVDVESAIAHFREHGYARLGRVVSDELLERLRARAQDLMLGRVVHEGLFFQLDAATGDYRDAPLGLGWQGPSLAYRKLEKLELDDVFRELIRHGALEPLVRALIPGRVRLYRAIVFNKAAAGGTEIPWHQDGGRLWGLSEDPQVQVWTALDDAPLDGGCLEVLPGSHRRGLATPLGGVVPNAQVEALEADARKLCLDVRAGESVLLHNLVWHRSGKTRTGHRRLGFSACYLPDSTVCVRKKRAPRAFFEAFP